MPSPEHIAENMNLLISKLSISKEIQSLSHTQIFKFLYLCNLVVKIFWYFKLRLYRIHSLKYIYGGQDPDGCKCKREWSRKVVIDDP